LSIVRTTSVNARRRHDRAFVKTSQCSIPRSTMRATNSPTHPRRSRLPRTNAPSHTQILSYPAALSVDPSPAAALFVANGGVPANAVAVGIDAAAAAFLVAATGTL